MKVYINTDIEGVAGWVFYACSDQGMANLRHLERMNALLTGEVNAAVSACLAAGADEIYVCDSHGPAYNILFEDLDPACRIIHGRGGHGPNWLPLLDESFDAAIAIGMHAMAGTPGAVCPHSMWHLTDGENNEIKLSECSMFAALCGTLGVPLVAISGDDKIAAEIKDKIPGCETAIVKQSFGAQNACCMVPARAHEEIYNKVLNGLNNRKNIKPLAYPAPYKLNVSDRDPAILELEKASEGNDFWQLMHDVCRCFGNKWGDQSIDDRSWRYPVGKL